MEVIKNYIEKFAGINKGTVPPRPTFKILIWSFIGAFLGISAVVGITTHSILADEELVPVVMGSIGAIAILIYGSIDVALAQPRNLIIGNLLSGLIGVVIQLIFSTALNNPTSLIWLKSGLAVAFSLIVMQLTRTVHPPAGATSLIAVTGGIKIYNLGFMYLLIPLLSSVLIMLVVALIVNNIQRQYPQYWWNPKVNKENIFFGVLKSNEGKIDKTDLESFKDEVNSNFDFNQDTCTNESQIPHAITIDITNQNNNFNTKDLEAEVAKLRAELNRSKEHIKVLEKKLNI